MEKEVVVMLRENNSRYISANKTFYVVSEKGSNLFNIGQHFDLSKFEKCVENGITVIVKPN